MENDDIAYRLHMHIAIALATVVVFGSAGVLLHTNMQASVVQTQLPKRPVLQQPIEQKKPVTADIVVRHSQPLQLSLRIAYHKDQSLIDVSHDQNEAIDIVLPVSWQRKEIRGARLSDVQHTTINDIRTWSIPTGARVTFNAKEDLANIFVHNPSGKLLSVDHYFLDMEDRTAQRDLTLIKDHGQLLW